MDGKQGGKQKMVTVVRKGEEINVPATMAWSVDTAPLWVEVEQCTTVPLHSTLSI